LTLRLYTGAGEQITVEEAAEQAAEALGAYDFNGDGKLQFEEFVAWVTGEGGEPKRDKQQPKATAAEPEERVIETRLSGFLTHLVVLTTLGWCSALRNVPIAVVNGVFFYLGRKVMSGNQFLERLRALAVPLPSNLDARAPGERSILVLGRKTAFSFTGLQLACLAILWKLKLTRSLGMVFPAAIGLLMVIRAQLLPRLFTRKQIRVIDTGLLPLKPAAGKPPAKPAASAEAALDEAAAKAAGVPAAVADTP